MAMALQSSVTYQEGSVLQEESGSPMRLTATVLVDDVDWNENKTRSLEMALDLASNAGFVVGAQPWAGSQLQLVTRTARRYNDRQIAIDLEWMAAGEAGLNFFWHGETVPLQILTERDVFGVPIVVGYQYPADWPYNVSKRGRFFTQGAEVPAQIPTHQLVGTGLIRTNFPSNFAQLWSLRTNSTYWNGGPPRTWRVESVQYQPMNLELTPRLWRFTFTMLNNLRGHDPDVVFVDEEIGRPPPGLVPGVGFRRVQRYPVRNFNELFPSQF